MYKYQKRCELFLINFSLTANIESREKVTKEFIIGFEGKRKRARGYDPLGTRVPGHSKGATNLKELDMVLIGVAQLVGHQPAN